MKNNIYCTIVGASAFALLTLMQIVAAEGSLESTMQKLKISQEVVPVTSYTKTIKVELHNNVIKPGDSVPAKNFKSGLDFNKIYWEVNNFDARYTLMLLDLDRKPSQNGTYSIYNQFTSLNIPGNAIAGGQIIVAFDPPSVPCQPSTKHRLVMLAFHQDQNIDLADAAYLSAPTGHSPRRENFKLTEFINRHRLELVAANIFSAMGEANGICSGGAATRPTQTVSTLLVAMVTLAIALTISDSRRMSGIIS